MTPNIPPDPPPPAPEAPGESGLNSPPIEPISSGKPGLTPEEQMAQFEDDLKENDWGHQPC